MVQHVSDAQSSDAWLSATRLLLQLGGDCFNLIVEIDSPTKEHVGVRDLLNRFLLERGRGLINEVENHLFPRSLYSPKLGRHHLYELCETALPLMSSFNRHDIYFQRMTSWHTANGPINQLEDTILKLRRSVGGHQRYTSRYEVSIYRPDADRQRASGFPCLSHLSFKLDGDHLHLTAMYRNQYYMQRAYGNFTGLGHLLEFVARESGAVPGRLTCVATHAEVESLPGGRKAIGELIGACLQLCKVS